MDVRVGSRDANENLVSLSKTPHHHGAQALEMSMRSENKPTDVGNCECYPKGA